MERRLKAANRVLEERCKLLEAEVVDLQLALLEKAQPCKDCDQLAGLVMTLRAENAHLRSKLKRARHAAREAATGLNAALATERTLRIAAEQNFKKKPRSRVVVEPPHDDDEVVTFVPDDDDDDDDAHLWRFPTNIVFPLAPVTTDPETLHQTPRGGDPRHPPTIITSDPPPVAPDDDDDDDAREDDPGAAIRV